jgi:hypothetical protein
MFSNFFPKIVSFMRMWKNAVQQGRPQMTIRRMCFAFLITKATDTQWEYVILIAFPQQWLHERVSLLLYVHSYSCYTLQSTADEQALVSTEAHLSRYYYCKFEDVPRKFEFGSNGTKLLATSRQRPNFFKDKGHIRNCVLVRGTHVEK